MTTINGKACVANGKAVNKVFSDGRQVYGRNYAQDTKDFGMGYWYFTSETTNASQKIVDGALQITSTDTAWHQSQLQSNGRTPEASALMELKAGDTYTLSFEARTVGDTSGKSIEVDLRANYDAYRINHIQLKTNITTLWSRYTVSGAIPADAYNNKSGKLTYWRLIFMYLEVGTVQYRRVKLEQGNKATDWSPAPEDILN